MEWIWIPHTKRGFIPASIVDIVNCPKFCKVIDIHGNESKITRKEALDSPRHLHPWMNSTYTIHEMEMMLITKDLRHEHDLVDMRIASKIAEFVMYGSCDISIRDSLIFKCISEGAIMMLWDLVSIAERDDAGLSQLDNARDFLKAYIDPFYSPSVFTIRRIDVGYGLCKSSGMVDIQYFPYLSTTWCSRGFLKSPYSKGSMLSYQPQDLHQSLIDYSKYSPKLSTSVMNQLQNDSKIVFRVLNHYIDYDIIPDPVNSCIKLLNYGTRNRLIRDELYFQVLKQCNGILSSVPMRLKLYKLLYLYLTTFPPYSKELYPILLSTISSDANSNITQYMPSYNLEDVAASCLIALNQRNVARPIVKITPDTRYIAEYIHSDHTMFVVLYEHTLYNTPLKDMSLKMTIRNVCEHTCIQAAIPIIKSGIVVCVLNSTTEETWCYTVLQDTLAIDAFTYWKTKKHEHPEVSYYFEMVRLGE